jgi:hypothetical protein
MTVVAGYPLKYSVVNEYLTKNGNATGQCLSYLYTSRKCKICLGGMFCMTFLLSLVFLMKLDSVIRNVVK